MKRNKKGNKWSAFLAILLLLCIVKQPVYAADPTSGNITIELTTDLPTSKEGVEFKIYKVGSWDSHTEKWDLASEWSDSTINLNNLTTNEGWDSAANTLCSKIGGSSSLSPTTAGPTDSNGKLTFSNLGLGMYLVVQDGTNNYGTISPFLISLPYKQNNAYDYNPTAKPKATAFSQGGEESNTPSGGEESNTPSGGGESNTPPGGGESSTPPGDGGSSTPSGSEGGSLENGDQNSTSSLTDNSLIMQLINKSQPKENKSLTMEELKKFAKESEQKSEAVTDESETDDPELPENGSEADDPESRENGSGANDPESRESGSEANDPESQESGSEADDPESQENNTSDTNEDTTNEKGKRAMAVALAITLTGAVSGGIIFVGKRRKK